MVFMLICMVTCVSTSLGLLLQQRPTSRLAQDLFCSQSSVWGLGTSDRGHTLCGAPLPILLPPASLLPGLGEGLMVQVLLDPGPHTICEVSHTWLASAQVSLLPSVASASL